MPIVVAASAARRKGRRGKAAAERGPGRAAGGGEVRRGRSGRVARPWEQAPARPPAPDCPGQTARAETPRALRTRAGRRGPECGPAGRAGQGAEAGPPRAAFSASPLPARRRALSPDRRPEAAGLYARPAAPLKRDAAARAEQNMRRERPSNGPRCGGPGALGSGPSGGTVTFRFRLSSLWTKASGLVSGSRSTAGRAFGAHVHDARGFWVWLEGGGVSRAGRWRVRWHALRA